MFLVVTEDELGQRICVPMSGFDVIAQEEEEVAVLSKQDNKYTLFTGDVAECRNFFDGLMHLIDRKAKGLYVTKDILSFGKTFPKNWATRTP